MKWCWAKPNYSITVKTYSTVWLMPCVLYAWISSCCLLSISVEMADESSCKNLNYAANTKPSGFLAKYTALTTGQGSVACPWHLRGQPGQRINITLWDFSWTSMANSSTECQAYAALQDIDGPRILTWCSRSRRVIHAYSSKGHELELHIIGAAVERDSDYFLFHYEGEYYLTTEA